MPELMEEKAPDLVAAGSSAHQNRVSDMAAGKCADSARRASWICPVASGATPTGDCPAEPFPTARHAAHALLAGEVRLSRRAHRFLAQVMAAHAPLSRRQSSWVALILRRADLPPLVEGDGR